MRPIRMLVLAVILTALATMSVAHADGPGGSSEHQEECKGAANQGDDRSARGESRRCETVETNNVTCGNNIDVAGTDVFIGPGGIEICNDDEDLPLQGRIMASVNPGEGTGFAGADGDRDNVFPADGWIGISTEAGTPLACGQRDPAGVGPPKSGLDHANQDDDATDCI